ncbi:dihydrolipoyllysine-residue succinyltransferase component of 2-oxoglutarate dehydrogenase complex [Zea mays]|uniref:dihydrolipoyllysine-residue succinyltransferase n=1 Tax=Zea mays TaxID=4577 RepID=B6SJN5_MAIZE|nr:dihydrolipoyllysine-residue succinyltransferase component of 2-oxoglutarate dehydrogenase complex [Zea mays]ACG25068.1 dihydrolipoyllysine-residue succinyltransferase component of 2-oxoglutarate dehydrogenase complex [Zea mays]|eukprot:NP_001147014.1 dihydrolipoyllysine-residue succinyltransferase component of 2-oxoglutarate dehydrogenase complex [Zea mays]
MASRVASGLLRRRAGATLGLLRSYAHVRSYNSQLSALVSATSECSNLPRRCYYLPNPSPYQVWSRSFASDNGDKFEAVVPFMGESVTDETLANFLKKPGDRVEADEPIAQIETDKVTIDVASPEAGVIEKLIASEGDTVTPGTKVAIISKSAQPAETHVAPSEEATSKESSPPKVEDKPKVEEKAPKVDPPKMQAPKPTAPSKTSPSEPQLPPKERERRVPMPRLRKRIANRLKDSQNTFAMLSTFNEVDMTNLMKLRSDYKDEFVTKHGVKLGLMSCFVKAAVSALQNQPIVNAVIDGDDIIYRDYVDISVAVGTSKGLVVPVIRDADTMNFADIEKGINNLAKKATEGALSIDDMAGGTFTISNGGVYGSLLSTPIINPPQSSILGMHSIVQRPVVVNGDILARPMMYLALTYDHRLIDGREAVFFLRRIKDVVEDPRRLLLDI